MRAQLTRHLHKLSVEIGCRPIGSPANGAAADYVRDGFRALDLAVEEQPYPCTGWDCRGAWLSIGGDIQPSPSAACRRWRSVPKAPSTWPISRPTRWTR